MQEKTIHSQKKGKSHTPSGHAYPCGAHEGHTLEGHPRIKKRCLSEYDPADNLKVTRDKQKEKRPI